MTDEPSNGFQPGPPILLTREQAAEWCQVSLNILDEWTYKPGFPVIRRNTGHFVRIHRAGLERWLEEWAAETNPKPVYEVPEAPRNGPRRNLTRGSGSS